VLFALTNFVGRHYCKFPINQQIIVYSEQLFLSKRGLIKTGITELAFKVLDMLLHVFVLSDFSPIFF